MNDIAFFYSPQTRASGVKVLLEELGASYDLNVVNTRAREQLEPAYLAVNPLGKVPAILDRGILVTEQAAIFIHLADRFRRRGWPRVWPIQTAAPICAGWSFTAPASNRRSSTVP